MKKIFKKLLPKKLFSIYHYLFSIFASCYYRFPSKRMIIVGVTGTKGKTSTVNFIWSVLMAGGIKTGIISTANIRIGEKEYLNKYHMTMPGSFVIQGLMSKMIKERCHVCVVETTSEGIKQHRHFGIYYDMTVFTNLFPEHLEAHGGDFEKYRKMKMKMFKKVYKHKKIIDGKKIKKLFIVNRDSKFADYFLEFKADKKITYSINYKSDYQARNILVTKKLTQFTVRRKMFKLNILGKFNVYNSLPAIIIGRHLKIEMKNIYLGLKNLEIIPGRMEKIDLGQNYDVFVDYAHEKESLTNVLLTAKNLISIKSKIIVLLGAEGGGRDRAKRPIMGEIAAKMADYVIISNVDPYEDDPKVIIEDIAVSAEKNGKKRNLNLWTIEDRRKGIEKALNLAKKDDIVLITGKGAEQSIVIGGKKSFWDDRCVVREILKNQVD